ncbi:MAG TPA: creatininase family protein [Acetobacteraceae bacterium]|nr:creatininase family protein [Acetobacteraceae bacterium]
MGEVRWERMTAPELREMARRDAVVVLPVASLEQHGPHLPVWTDSMIGHAVAVRGAELAADLPAVVLPPLWTGLSEHHFPFGGTISLDHAAFAAVLRCVARSILADGFRRLFLLNSHGGNIEALASATRELAHELRLPVATAPVSKLAPEAVRAALRTQPGIQHACEAETSLWLHLDPAQVRQEEVARAVSPGGFSAGDAAVTRFWSFAERAPETGVRGDPRAATAETGRVIFEAMAEGLARMLRDPAIWRAPDDVWRPGRATGPVMP